MTRRKMIDCLHIHGVTSLQGRLLEECYTFELRRAVAAYGFLL